MRLAKIAGLRVAEVILKKTNHNAVTDICSQARTGNIAGQAMLISGADNRSQLALCLAAAGNFMLSRPQTLQLQIKKSYRFY